MPDQVFATKETNSHAGTCTYCRAVAIEPFPKEHVVPRAFGRFCDNLTLKCVCGKCNSFFNQELKLLLTRDSVEALLRVRYGLRRKSGHRKPGDETAGNHAFRRFCNTFLRRNHVPDDLIQFWLGHTGKT